MSDRPEAVVPVFKTMSVKSEAKSKKEGRPIYEDVEICEIRFPGDRQRVVVQPAHHIWKWVDQPDGGREPLTYAMRFKEQYRRFKESRQQVQEGTPLEELPFLTQAKRLELRALSIYTAEALAGLEGNNLKALGLGGRELKTQAQAYLDKATGSAEVTELAAKNAALEQQVEELRKLVLAQQTPAAPQADETSSSAFAEWSVDDLKAYIENETGSKPRGNPSKATLVTMCDELEAAKQAAE